MPFRGKGGHGHRLHEHHRTLREAEVWLKDVPRAASFRVALVYPNLYYVGCRTWASSACSRLLNAQPDVVCERAFLPDDIHTEELEQSGSPLVTLDTATPLRDFDMVAFSVSFENDYLHVAQGPAPGRHSPPGEGPRPTAIPSWSWAAPPSS